MRCHKVLTLYIASPPRVGSLSLRSIMLMIAAISVGLGLLRSSPILGVVCLGLFVPALGRTLYFAEVERAWSTPMDLLDLSQLFLSSLIVWTLLLFAVGLCFLTVTSGLHSGGGIVGRDWTLSTIFAAIPTLALGIWLGAVLLPRKKS